MLSVHSDYIVCSAIKMASIDAAVDPAQHEKIVHFVSVTGADDERARFFLQAAAWNLEVTSHIVVSSLNAPFSF